MHAITFTHYIATHIGGILRGILYILDAHLAHTKSRLEQFVVS